MTSLSDLWLFAVGAFWVWRAIRACAALRHVPFLPPLPGAAALDRVAVIAVVRDAEHARTVAAALANQRGVALQAIVVDASPHAWCDAPDHADPVAVPVGPLPEGWLPRSHALATGIAHAEHAEWLLLMDEPVTPTAPDAVARALAWAHAQRTSSLAIVPRTPAGWLAPLVLSGLADTVPMMASTNRDRATLPWVGPVFLIRARALARVGGMPALRMAPVAELMLGELLHEEGERTRVVQAQDEFCLVGRLGRDQLVETLERLLGTVGFRVLLLVIALAVYVVLWCTSVIGAFLGTPSGIWACAGLIAQVVPGLWIAHAHRTPLVAALLVPLTLPVEVALSLATAVRLRLRNGVTWQGHFVSIDALRDQD